MKCTEITSKNKWKNCCLNTPLGNGGLSLIHPRSVLKAVLFHSGNTSKFHSIPLVRAVYMKETYQNLQIFF